jgi:hypothetical protein
MIQKAEVRLADNVPGRFPSSYGMVSDPCGVDALSFGHI